MLTQRPWLDPEVTAIGRLPMRTPMVPCPDIEAARTHDPSASPWWRSLDGTWQFRLLGRPEELTEELVGPGDDDGWDTITVPGAWTTQGFGCPQYTNVVMPFDLEPPVVPGDNPTGVYRRVVSVPRDWRGRRTVLRIGAAESVAMVWVDGVAVGLATDSRLPSEFDVTDVVRAGRRATVVIAVVKWSAQTWVEDQDQWWHGGLQRSVTLHSTAPTHLADAKLVPGLEPATDGTWTGTLDVEVTVDGPARREPGWTAEVHVETEGGRRVAGLGPLDLPAWNGEGEASQLVSAMFVRPGVVEGRIEVRRARPWSAEDPHRYRAVVTLRDPSGEVVEVGAVRTGFRSVEVSDRQLLVNGAPVLIHGVNHHEHDPNLGRAVSEELTRTDLLLMKAHNLNAVRASHYPHDEHFAALCDELGLYVVDEANVESHGRQASLCHDPRYGRTMVERVERMARRDKHHPSVILWSLGNESGYGPPHDEAAAFLRRYDPSRPLHYEGPLMHDLRADAPVTDIICPMYSEITEVVDRARWSGDTRRPVILCEYSHAMGNSNGSLADYWHAFETVHGLQGGFIWEWLEHGIPRSDRPGDWGYGGDFGDHPNDGNFICDGLISADRVPHPAMEEVRHVGRPVRCEVVEADRGRVRFTNTRHFTDTSDLRARWVLEVDGNEVDGGELDLSPIPPRRSVAARVPVLGRLLEGGGEALVRIRWEQRRATPWARAGAVVGQDQFPVPTRPRPGPTTLHLGGGTVPTAPAGGRRSPAVADVPPVELVWTPTVFRALTDNDAIQVGWMREWSPRLSAWEAQGIDRCTWEPGAVRRRRQGDATLFSSTGTLRPGGDGPAIRVGTRLLEGLADGWTHLSVTITVPAALDDVPRVGITAELPGSFEDLEWFGDGPHDSYADRRSSVTVGRWRSTVSAQYVPYAFPQEHGHHTGLRWLALRDDRHAGLLVVADGPMGFAARHHGDAELYAATHAADLSTDGALTHLYLDAAQRGLGTGSCGPDALERYRVRPGRHRVAAWLRWFDPRHEDPATLSAAPPTAG